MKIVVVAPFCSLPGEAYFNRFLYLSQLLSKEHNVVLVTSSFRHFDKSHRQVANNVDDAFEVVLINEPGYKGNISLNRVWSHSRFVRNFKVWARDYFSLNRVDVVYSAYPLLATNIFLGENKRQYGYRLVVDVQDVWPEAISGALPFVRKLPLSIIPFSKKADRAYALADALVAVSDTYLDRALSVNSHAKGVAVYIGSDGAKIDAAQPLDLGGGVHFVYIGTLSHSYDIETILTAFKFFSKAGLPYYLHVLGGGPRLHEIQETAADSVKFYGFVMYEEMLSIAKGADFLVNPIKDSAMQTVTNKLSDYVMLERPIISSQRGKEVDQIMKSVPSFHYEAGDVESFKSAVEVAVRCPRSELICDAGVNKSLFDRRVSYEKISNFISALVEGEGGVVDRSAA